MYLAQKLVHSRSSVTLVQKFFIYFCLKWMYILSLNSFKKTKKRLTFYFISYNIINRFGNVEIAFDNETLIKNRIIMQEKFP